MEQLESGQKWVHRNRVYWITRVEEEQVIMKSGMTNKEVSETITRFIEEANDGVAVLHKKCRYCGIEVNPENGHDETLHYECWFEQASVKERCKAERNRSGGNRLASEAIQSDIEPKTHLLNVIGDPSRTSQNRYDAENLLTGSVPVEEIIEASVRCPSCNEGEYFEMSPETGEVRCHCGILLQPAD